MMKQQNYESVRINELKGEIEGVREEIEKKVRSLIHLYEYVCIYIIFIYNVGTGLYIVTHEFVFM